MVQTLEKNDVRDVPMGHLYYNQKTVQKGFKLPSTPTFFLHESFLLCFYFLRDKRFRQIAGVIFRLVKDLRKRAHHGAPLLLNAFIEEMDMSVDRGRKS